MVDNSNYISRLKYYWQLINIQTPPVFRIAAGWLWLNGVWVIVPTTKGCAHVIAVIRV